MTYSTVYETELAMFGERTWSMTARSSPGGEDRIDDLAQAWIDGDHERVRAAVASHEAEVRARPVLQQCKLGRRPHIDYKRVRELRAQGWLLRDIADFVKCSVTQAGVICRTA